MKEREGYWHALPRDVARWWRMRAEVDVSLTGVVEGRVQLTTEGVTVQLE
jgi:hypothetical protein